MQIELDEQPIEEVDVVIEDSSPIVQPDSLKTRLATRFLFLAIDVTRPSVKRAHKRMRFGGHEVISECLAHTMGFVQRGRLTPLVRSGEPILEENAPEGADFFPINVQRIEVAGAMAMQGMSDSALGAINAYPGDHLSVIMNGSSSEIDGRKIGLVEVRALMGHNYTIEQLAPGLRVDRNIWEIQRYFFPEFPKVPTRIVDFRAMLQSGYDRTTDSTYRSIAEDGLMSCEIGGLWCNETLDAKERLIAQSRGHQGYAYVYDELDEVLLEQTGRDKVEQGGARMAAMLAETAQSGRADVREFAAAIKDGNREFARMLAEELAQVRAEKAEAVAELVVEPVAEKTEPKVTPKK